MCVVRESTSDAYLTALDHVYNNPEYKSAPRGLPIRERVDYMFTVLNPTAEPITTLDEERNKVIADYTRKEMDINGVKGQGAIRWKSWKKNVQPPDSDYVKTELIDILHFTLEMLLIWGADAEEIYRRYVGKNQENLARYRRGY